MKRGKKYVEAAKLIDRATLYEATDLSLIHVVMDVMLISRSEVQLFFHTEQVRLLRF